MDDFLECRSGGTVVTESEGDEPDRAIATSGTTMEPCRLHAQCCRDHSRFCSLKGKMKTTRRPPQFVIFVFLAVGIWVLPAAEVKFPLPPDTSKLKSGFGLEVVSAQCLLCHSADYISTQPKLSRAAWKVTVLKMQQKYGAPIQTNAVDSLVEYLSKNYGSESASSSISPGK